MITIYCQTIESSTDQHASWYSHFASAFLFCQLTNRLLLSYMESYVTQVTAPEWERTPQFQERASSPPFAKKLEIACDLDIEDFLQEIISSFTAQANRQKNDLLAMGLEISGFHDEPSPIDLTALRHSIPELGWHEIIKGLLNCYEFSHLSSIVEQGLKEATKNKTADGIVSSAIRQSPELLRHLETEWGLTRDFLVKTWDLYRHVRNMYAHSFGFIDEKNIEQIQGAKVKAIEAMANLDIRWNLAPFNPEKEFFPESKFNIGEMYLLGDSELNIFRNFSRIFMPALAKYYHSSNYAQ